MTRGETKRYVAEMMDRLPQGEPEDVAPAFVAAVGRLAGEPEWEAVLALLVEEGCYHMLRDRAREARYAQAADA